MVTCTSVCEPRPGHEVLGAVERRFVIWHRDQHIWTQHRNPRVQDTDRAHWPEFHREEDWPSDTCATDKA